MQISTACAQWSESFDSTQLDNWKGDLTHFIINSDAQLQLNAPQAGQSALLRSFIMEDSMVWRIHAEVDFAPSTNNNLIILITADSINYEDGKSLYLKIGSSGNQDAIEFYYRQNGQDSLLAKGISARVAQKFSLTLELTRNANNQWSLKSYDSESSIATDEFTILHTPYPFPEMSYFGMVCQYTTSNTDAFLFDDIRVQALARDTIAPEIINSVFQSSDTLKITFSEALDTSSLMQAFFQSTPALSVKSTQYLKDQFALIFALNEHVNSCQNYTLQIGNIKDTNGNTMNDWIKDRGFAAKALSKEIMISEILSDPIAEGSDFIEIKNTGSRILDLNGLVLINNQKEDTVIITTDQYLLAGGYIVITDDTSHLQSIYGDIPTERMIQNKIPSFNNSSGNVTIGILNEGQIVNLDEVNYSDSWHNPDISDTEAFSLERKNYAMDSNDSDSWTSSLSSSKGTPGYENSVFDEKTVHITGLSSDSLKICFNTIIKPGQLMDATRYHIPNNTIMVVGSQDQKCVLLKLDVPLKSGVQNEITILPMNDLCDNSVLITDTGFKYIEPAHPGELLINEILFDPYPEQHDFVEIINNSNKYIELSGLIILNQSNGQYEVIEGNHYLAPEEIIALTLDTNSLQSSYLTPLDAGMMLTKLPAFNNSDGNVSLLRLNGMDTLVIDAFDYSEEMHNPILTDTEGVSLERISVKDQTNNRFNWNSASTSSLYATPGYQNSSTYNTEESSELFTLKNATFSPDGDGYNDILVMHYALNGTDYVGNIYIFDDLGYFKTQLINNAVMGQNGLISWNGNDRYSRICPEGVYLIVYEFYNTSGQVVSGKEVCILASKIN